MVATLTNSELGRKIKDAAKEAGYTLIQLGNLLGVSRPTIYAYASGALRVTNERLVSIAEITGKPITFFQPSIPEHLDQKSVTAQSLRLIDALMSPASPIQASKAAMQAIEGIEEPMVPGIRAELLRRTGNALAMNGEYIESIRYLEDARDLFHTVDEQAKIGSCNQTLGFCYTSLGNLQQAKNCFERALNLLPNEQTWKAEVAIAALLEREGKFDDAEAKLSSLLDDPEFEEVPLAYIRANFASIVCSRGRWKSGLAQTETALQAAYSCGLADQVAELLIQGATALTFMGRLSEATIMASRARDIAFALHDEARSTLAEVSVARLFQAFEEPVLARATASTAHSRAIRGQFRRSESQALTLLGELAFERGDYELAVELAEQTISHAKAHTFLVAEASAHMTALRSELATSKGAKIPERLKVIKACAGSCGESRYAVIAQEAEALVSAATGNTAKAAEHFAVALDIAERRGLKLDIRRIGNEMADLKLSRAHVDQDARGHKVQDNHIWVNILKGLPIDETSLLPREENMNS